MTSDLSQWTAHVSRKSWFLGIGINAYQHYTPLSNAVKDVRDIMDLLIREYDVEPEYAITLFDDQASEANIIAALEGLAQEVGPEDKLLVYYSGHGIVHHHTQLAYWIPIDGQPGVSADLIGNSTIHDHLSVIPAKHILLISDSCYSGSIFLRGRSRSARVTESMENTASRWALCSGRGNETVYDGNPGTNSPFAKSLLDALTDNQEDALNISKVVERVREQTAAHSAQIPEGNPLRLKGHQGGQYVFRKKGTALMHQKDRHEPDGMTHAQSTQTKQRTLVGTAVKHSHGRLIRVAGITIPVLIALFFIFPLFNGKDSGPLAMKLTVSDNAVEVNVSGGKPVYVIDIMKDDVNVYEDTLIASGQAELLFDEFHAVPGGYELIVKDGTGVNMSKSFDIPPSDVAINAFHTTTGMNSSNLWPTDQAERFSTGQPVYIYANLTTDTKTDIVFNWYDSNHQLLFTPEIRTADPGEDPVIRLITYRTFSEPGSYLVVITDSSGVVLGQTVFQVAKDPG